MGRPADLLQTLAGEIGVRQCGTDAARRAADAVAAAFLELGLVPEFQEFPFLRYDAEEPELWVDGERWQAGPCMYAHPGVCEGEIEALSDGLWGIGEGRLARSIFGRGPIPFVGRLALAGHIATPPTAFLSRADCERIRPGQHAKLVVRGRFVEGRRDRNVIARIPGRSNERVIVGAHYDSVWHGPGAIDNASGVEGLRRVAAHFAGTQPACTIELVAFGAEEVGLVGARRYVSDARDRDTLGSISGMVNLDCIGCGDTLELLCSPPALLERTRATAERLGLTQRYEVVTELGEEAGTDHLPFSQAGIPAVSILHFPYEEYHLPEDTLALVDEQRLADAVALAIELVQSLVDEPVMAS